MLLFISISCFFSISDLLFCDTCIILFSTPRPPILNPLLILTYRDILSQTPIYCTETDFTSTAFFSIFPERWDKASSRYEHLNLIFLSIQTPFSIALSPLVLTTRRGRKQPLTEDPSQHLCLHHLLALSRDASTPECHCMYARKPGRCRASSLSYIRNWL